MNGGHFSGDWVRVYRGYMMTPYKPSPGGVAIQRDRDTPLVCIAVDEIQAQRIIDGLNLLENALTVIAPIVCNIW